MAQRSGIISGMTIDEIKIAKTQKVSGYNFIMVSEHKTGSHQPAKIFVPSNIFRALTIFTEAVLPKLPI